MNAEADITALHYAGFVLSVVCMLAVDLGFFHRSARPIRFLEALGWTLFWCTLSILFAFGFIMPKMGRDASLNFVLGYVIELSLSMDNVMVIAVIFSFFKVPAAFQHRVLFWGILGALVMRGLMIFFGVELIRAFSWTIYFLGAFLVFTGIKMVFGAEEEVNPESNPIIRFARRVYPITHEFDGQKFITISGGKRALTPLALVLVMVETTDLIFAVDSIPAIFAITLDPFIIFTSNVCAILGLRSLYFVLAGAIGYFKYLKVGLSLVLVFIGGKMLVAKYYHIPTNVSLMVVGGILLLSVLLSLVSGLLQRGKGIQGPKAGDSTG